MSAFAVAHLRSVTMGPEIQDYLSRIDATLQPYAGRFLIHGSSVEMLEGTWAGDLVIIEFPDGGLARGWYRSPAYQQILRLRTDNSDGCAFLADGVVEPHHGTDILRTVPAANDGSSVCPSTR